MSQTSISKLEKEEYTDFTNALLKRVNQIIYDKITHSPDNSPYLRKIKLSSSSPTAHKKVLSPIRFVPGAFLYSFVHKHLSVNDYCFEEVGMPFISAMVRKDRISMNDLILKAPNSTMSIADLVNARAWATSCLQSDTNILGEALKKANIIAQNLNENLKIEYGTLLSIALYNAFKLKEPLKILHHYTDEDYENIKSCVNELLLIASTNQMNPEKEIVWLLNDIKKNQNTEIKVDLVNIDTTPALLVKEAVREKNAENVAKLLAHEVKKIIVERYNDSMQLNPKGEIVGQNQDKIMNISELCNIFLPSFIEHVCKKHPLMVSDERLKHLKVTPELREKVAQDIVSHLYKDKVIYNNESYIRYFLKSVRNALCCCSARRKHDYDINILKYHNIGSQQAKSWAELIMIGNEIDLCKNHVKSL